MQRLFKIKFKHYSPKDSEEGVRGFISLDSEEEALKYVLKLSCMGDDLSEPVEVWDLKTDETHTSTLGAELLKNKGLINYDGNDYSDAYYGITHYGYEDCGEVSYSIVKTLQAFGLMLGNKDD